MAALADPNMLSFDELLALDSIRCLEGVLIHDLLTVFVTQDLAIYNEFYDEHNEFVDSIEGLTHEKNLKKMQKLQFKQLAENSREITFERLHRELQRTRMNDRVNVNVVDLIGIQLL